MGGSRRSFARRLSSVFMGVRLSRIHVNISVSGKFMMCA